MTGGDLMAAIIKVHIIYQPRIESNGSSGGAKWVAESGQDSPRIRRLEKFNRLLRPQTLLHQLHETGFHLRTAHVWIERLKVTHHLLRLFGIAKS